MQTEPLNPVLYASLKRVFGTVKISNQGQRQESFTRLDALTNCLKETITVHGESYKVNCPYCGDRRHRLSISYRWNTVTEKGQPYGRHLILCFNERCRQVRDFEEDYLSPYIRKHPVIPSALQSTTQNLITETTLPGHCIDLRELPADHPAWVYLRGRNFEPAELAVRWGVRFCADAPEDEKGCIPGTTIITRLVRNRVIIPVFWNDKLVGWQARSLGDHKIKYYTAPGMPKSQLLFNGDRARKHKFGVIVEGVFDAFRVGEPAVALLGKHASQVQKDLILSYWYAHGAAVLLDSDAAKDSAKIASSLIEIKSHDFKHGLFNVPLPAGHDPASMTHADVWARIAQAATAESAV